MAHRDTFSEFNPAVEDFDCYVERLSMYFEANDIDEEKQKSVFLSVLGPKHYSLLRSLCAPDAPSTKTFDQLVATLKAHVSPKPLVIAERFKFHNRRQANVENVKDFAAELRRLASTCDFGQFLSEALRDRFVCGLSNASIQKKLLSEKDLTFAKAIDIAHGMEAAASHSAALHSQNPEETDNSEVNVIGKHAQSAKGKTSQHQAPASSTVCYRCGKKHLSADCPYKQYTCNHCKKVGHLASVCRSRLKANKASANQLQSEDENVGMVNHNNQPKKDNKPFTATLQVEGKPVLFEIDTGASVSLMSEQAFNNTWRKKKPQLKACTTKLRTYTGQQIPVLGQAQVNVSHKGHSASLRIIVVSGRGPCLLGRDWIRGLNIESEIFVNRIDSSATCQAELSRFPNLFKDELGTVKSFPATLHVEENSKPRFYKARTVPYALRGKVDAELQRLEDAGIIEPVKYSAWAAPIVPVLKPDGSVRLCGDYKVTVNQVAKADVYPLPRIEDLFNKVAGGKTFTKLDLTHAYQQLPLTEDSKDLTTINTPKGLFRYTRLPFGVSAAPAIFQRTMDCLLQDIPQVAVFQDDILISGSSDEAHLQHLGEVLRRLDAEGFRLKKEKCQFMLPEVTYLGHRITSEGIQPTADKVKAVQDAPTPKDASQLKSFLGLVNFYGKFLPHLSTVLSPLNNLLRKGTVFKWGKQQSQAFEKVKTMLQSADLLVHYNPELEVTLSCDASAVGLGAVLAHRLPDGTELPIAYASRTLNKAEQNYSNIEREALAVTFGVKKFRDYLFGRHFWLYTDHKPLITLFNEHKPVPSEVSPRIQRWAMQLSAYTYTICYKPGSSMTHADALSRLPLPETSPETEENVPEELVFLMDHLSTIPVTAADIQREIERDPVLSRVKKYTLSGWPSELPSKLQPDLKLYKSHESELSVQSGCVILRTRVVVPPACRKAMLEELHTSHSGINKMKCLARSYIWWPGLDHDIEVLVQGCEACQQVRHMPEKAPLHPWEWPEKPWSRLHIDFAGPFLKHMFLVVVDSHSKWTEVRMMNTVTAEKTICCIRELFVTHGLPDTIVSDNGPTFTSAEFKKFLKDNGVRQVLVAPYHPASNGLAERAVQSFKEAMKKMSNGYTLHQKMCMYLINQHVTPHATTGVAPAELLMRRSLKTRLDLIRPSLASKVEEAQSQQKNSHDRSAKERHFAVGDKVYARNFASGNPWLHGVISEVTGPLSFKVQLTDGRVVRRHLDQVRSRWADNPEAPPLLPMSPDPLLPEEDLSDPVLPQPMPMAEPPSFPPACDPPLSVVAPTPKGSSGPCPATPARSRPVQAGANQSNAPAGPSPGSQTRRPAEAPAAGEMSSSSPAAFSAPVPAIAERPRRLRKAPDRLNL
jgi:hypothetical protein